MIVNMCVQQQKSKEVDSSIPKQVRLKSVVDIGRLHKASPSITSSVGSIHGRSNEKTPLPDALKVQPQKQADSVVQALQKEWQSVLNKSLFEYPIPECSIVTKQSTLEEAIVELKPSEIDFRRPQQRSKTSLKQHSKKSLQTLTRVQSASTSKIYNCSCKSKGSLKDEAQEPSYQRKTCSSKHRELNLN